MRRGLKWSVVLCALSALGALACVAEDAADGLEGEEPIATETEALWQLWSDVEYPPAWSSFAVGMAKNDTASNSNSTYTWYDDGFVCSGTLTSTCKNMGTYTAPDDFANIAGITMALSTNGSHYTYTHYLDETYSRGTVHDLDAVHGKRAFNSGPFRMQDLIDVAHTSVVAKYYYYWRNQPVSGGIKRTIGTLSDCCYYSGIEGTTVVNDEDTKGPIIGIEFDESFGSPTVWRLESWYANGDFNWTRDTRDLTQPYW